MADNYDEFYTGAPVCARCNLVSEPDWVSPTFGLGSRRPDDVRTNHEIYS